MRMNLYRETAEIFDIFSGKRISAGGDSESSAPVVEQTFERHPDAMDANAWYHDTAVRDYDPWNS